MHSSKSIFRRLTLASLLGGAACIMAGCGLGAAAPAGDGFAPPATPDEVVGGEARGGYSPIVGAYAYLYESQDDGYLGQGALVAHNLPQSHGGTTAPDGENLTGASGEFSFTVGSTCTPGSILYVVISGGVSGGSSSNNQILETAPIGLCGAGGQTVSSFTYVNELSTVATAYALGNFISIDASLVPAVGTPSGAYVVNMSAPANNDASPVSGAAVPSAGNCTNGATYVATGSNAVNTGTTCTASGLRHSYGDVAKLVNVNVNSLKANTAVPNNANSAVPQALVNSLASMMQGCVNSNGLTAANGATNISFTGGGTSTLTLTAGAATDLFDGSMSYTLTNGGTTNATVTAASNTLAEVATAINTTALNGAGVAAAQSNGVLTVTAVAGTLTETGSVIDVGNDGTVCGTLMALAMPQANDAVPQNTLQAAMNIAKNPYVNASNVQKLFGLLTGQPAFTPVLTAAPPDWTIAVSYLTPLPQSGGVMQTAGDAFVPTLDADDNVYVAENNADPYNATSTVACINSFTHAGVLQSGTGWGCNAISGSSSYVDIAPDALGNLWTANANNGTSNAGRVMLQFSAANGSLLNTYVSAGTSGSGRLWGVAVDKQNDVDLSVADQNQGNVQALLNNSGLWTPTNLTGSPKYSASARQMALDVNGNLWGAEYGSAGGVEGGALGVLPSVTTAPTYNDSSYPVVDAAVAGGTTGTSTGNSGADGVAVDANGNVWVSNIGEGTYSGVLGISEATAPTLYPVQSAPVVGMVFSNATNTGIVSPKYMEVDGANNLWVADTNGYHEFSISSTAEMSESGGFKPCYLGANGNATACSASSDALSRGIAIDSAGDVWTVYSDQLNAASKAQGRLYQLIGSAFPTWPLKAQQQPGIAAGCAAKLVNGQCGATGTPSSVSVNMASYAGDCAGHSQSTLCIESLQDAIAQAASALALNGNVTYTINIPAGTFDLSDQGPLAEGGTVVDNQGNPILNSQGNAPSAVIVVDSIAPSGSGSLNILGAGSGSTTLIISDFISEIEGTGVSHIHFGGMRWQTKDASTTQGTVTASGPGYVTISVPTGFPTPLAIYDDVTNLSTQGRFLRVYDNSTPSQPTLNTSTANINQIPWGYNSNTSTYLPPVQVGPNSWKLYFNNPTQVAPSIYTAANQIACVKSKLAAQAYDFFNENTFSGVDVGFDDFIWQDVSRGTWRNFTYAYVTNSKIVRRPPPASNPTQGFCLSTAAGGPQYSQPGDTTYPIGYFYVNNFTADSTGDDSIAIFNDTTNTSIISNTVIGNSFARNINLYQSCKVQLISNTGYDCNPNPPWNVPTTYNGCITDTSPTECPGSTL